MKKKFKFYLIALVGFTFFATLFFLLPAKAQFQQSQLDYVDLAALEDNSKDSHPKMESVLYRLLNVYSSAGLQEAKGFAGMRGIDFEGDLVRVELEAQLTGTGELETRIVSSIVKRQVENLGGKVETSFQQSIQACVPLDALRCLADLESIRYMRRPIKPHPLETSEGVASTGADKWHSLSSFHSQGSAKVCILDAGFQGYQNLLGTDLPASVTTKSFRADGDILANQKHGAGCAEIVHDMAPDAQLWLVNFQYHSELQNAVNWIVQQGVDIISYSMGSYVSGAGDGTGPTCELVKFAHDNGITWVSAAGNSAEDHWQDYFYDSDSDNWHNFSGGDEMLRFSVPAYTVVYAYLKWNDWGTWNGYYYSGSDQDYDLYLYYYNGTNWVYIDHSSNDQTGTQWPYEAIYGWYSNVSTYWGVAIYNYNASQNLKMDLYIPYHTGSLEYSVPEASIILPADSPYAVSVGAVDAVAFTYHSYSSRGPTLDGRIKPDLAAPSGVSCVTYGSYAFFGTSAACPHVAGALALLKIKTPFDLDTVKSIIEARAEDLGPAGKDNKFGLGRLKLD